MSFLFIFNSLSLSKCKKWACSFISYYRVSFPPLIPFTTQEYLSKFLEGKPISLKYSTSFSVSFKDFVTDLYMNLFKKYLSRLSMSSSGVFKSQKKSCSAILTSSSDEISSSVLYLSNFLNSRWNKSYSFSDWLICCCQGF